MMRKDVKKLGAFACAAILGLGLTGNTVLAAAPGKADTNVYYTANSSNIDADGKIVMVIPADVNLNKNKTEGTTQLKLKTSNGQNFDQFGQSFAAKIGVESKNGGKLKNQAGNIEAEYKLSNESEKKEADWTNPGNNNEFAQFDYAKDNASSESTKNLKVSVEKQSVEKLEKADPGTQFSDVLTFKVTSLTGEGLQQVQQP